MSRLKRKPASRNPDETASQRPGFPFWTRLQSHWKDILLQKIPPPPEPPLELFLRKGRLMLASPGAIYSMEEDYGSYVGAFRQLDQHFRPSRVLVLGFGLGSIPLILERLHGFKPEITGLECDSRIAALARHYLPADLLARTTLIVRDALDWVQQAEPYFDLIAVDLYVDTEVPAGCANPGFLRHLRRLTAPGGYLFLSRLNQESDEARQTFEQAFKKEFPDARQIKVGGNTIYFWRADSGNSGGQFRRAIPEGNSGG